MSKYKRLPWWGLPLLGLVLSSVLLGLSQRHMRRQPTRQVDIQIEEQADNFFLDLGAVKQLVGVDESVVSLRREDVDLARMERRLRATGYVEHVAAAYNTNGKLTMSISLRRPIVRVVDDVSGTSLYIDANGHRIKRNMQFTARVPVVRGAFTEQGIFSPAQAAAGADTLRDSTLRSCMPFFRHLDSDPFLRAQVAEIVVDRRGNITLYPQVGHTKIVFGSSDRFVEKCQVLRGVYQNILHRNGWQSYHTLNVSYRGQVVAERQPSALSTASN